MPASPSHLSADNLNTGQASVTNSATSIISARGRRHAVTIINTGSATVYIGNSNAVTITTGFPVPAGTAVTLDYNGAVFGIAAAAGPYVVGFAETW